jgi:Concanavalin A-like lectin/glucanases superfamily
MPPVGDTIPLALTGSKAAGFANSPILHSTTSINSGQWIHLAFVRYAHATSGYVRLFVNGQPEATDTSNGQSASDAGQLVVAANPIDGRYYVGSMDDLRLYNTALSDGEIADVYNVSRTTPQWTTNNLPAGLIAWWQAEGNFLDSAGANHLQADGNVTFASGRFGQAFQFDGVTNSAAGPAPALNDWAQFTLEAWINLDATNDVPGAAWGRGIISRVGDPVDHNLNFGYQFGIYDGSRQVFCQFNTNGQSWPGFQTTAPFPAPLVTGVWYHVAATYDHNATKLYFNGVPLITNVVGPATVVHSPSLFRVSRDDNFNVPFPGRIDDARIYNRALTAVEIAYLYTGIPWLTLTRTNDQITLSWLVSEGGWVLERTNVIAGASAPWPEVPPPYQTNAGMISVTLTNPPPLGNQFFRLHKP